MGNAIFEDLEIDHHDMLSNPEGFAQRVYEKADELRAICKSDTSTSAFMERYKAEGVKIPQNIQALYENLYDEVDMEDLNIMVDAIKQARKLVSDLETAFKDRCIRKAAEEGTAIGNKRVAHAQYTRLKDDFNLYAKALSVIMAGRNIELKQLPNLPGNYGSGTSSLIHYVFELDGEQYRNHHVVCRKLGIETRSLMDLLEYIEKNDTGIVVKEVQ